MDSTWLPVLAVLVALAVDRGLGEPAVRWHPVVWMGNYLGWSGRMVQARTRLDPAAPPDYQALWLGTLAWFGGVALIGIAVWGLQAGVDWVQTRAGLLWAALLTGLLLKPLLAWALLKREVLAVEAALSNFDNGSLEGGRARLRWLVSRDVTSLSESQVRESAIESLAENLNDSVIAPLFWFALLGLPGAALFRFANTADAMWGYRGVYQGKNWAWAGKWAARADDVLAWVPARVTALMLVMVAGKIPLKRLHAEAARTPSPNSGWPMAAMALALGVRLGKPGAYVLNADGAAPQVSDTRRAVRCASNTLLALVFVVFVAMSLIFFVGLK
jgi:adenosylcobinamide-phosphate synthase